MLTDKSIEEFIFYIRNNLGLATKTALSYNETLKQALPFVDSYEEGKTVFVDMTRYRLFIAKQGKKTIARKVSTLRSFFEHQKMLGAKFRLIGDEQVKVSQTLPKPMPAGTLELALQNQNPTERLVVLLLYGLGLRVSELGLLKVEQIKNGWATVYGKGGKTRQVPLMPELAKELQEHIKTSDCKQYVLEENGAPLSYAKIRAMLKKSFDIAGVKATPHRLRHSYATDLLNGGARLNDVSELLGHAQLATTKIYTKLSTQTKLKSYLAAHPMCDEG